MSEFKIDSKFNPTGDQPKAIKELVEGVNNGDKYQTLLGVTGSGKTFTIAKSIENRHIGENCAPILDTLFPTLVSPSRILPKGKCDSTRSLRCGSCRCESVWTFG